MIHIKTPEAKPEETVAVVDFNTGKALASDTTPEVHLVHAPKVDKEIHQYLRDKSIDWKRNRSWESTARPVIDKKTAVDTAVFT